MDNAYIKTYKKRVNPKMVKENAQNLPELLKLAAQQKIKKKIRSLQKQENRGYSKKELEQFLKRNKINSKIISLIYSFIYKKYIVNLSLEDFKIITKNTKAAKLHFLDINNFERNSMDVMLKPKLEGMKNAILIITGNKNTTLDELDMVWESTLRNLPKNSKTSCAYKIGNVKNLQVNLLAIK